MRVISREDVEYRLLELLDSIDKGAVFVYPTDTIYGIGCNAMDKKAVQRVRDCKNQHEKPLSVIAPSLDWIRENCIVPKEAEEWLKKLPGAFTLVLKLKNKNAVPKEVNLGVGTIGIRIPDHWTLDLVRRLGKPVVTTSVNLTGEEFMTHLDNLNPAIKSKCNFIIYEDRLEGKPSAIVDLSKDAVTVKKR